MAKYLMAVKNLGPMRSFPDEGDPLRVHRATIRAVKRLYPDAEVELFAVTNNNGRKVKTALKPDADVDKE